MSLKLRYLASLPILLLVALFVSKGQSNDRVDASGFLTNFDTGHRVDEAALRPARLDGHIDYSLDPSGEKFLVHLPSDYDERESYGLVVYIHPGSTLTGLPEGWQSVLDKRRLLFVAPLRAGNEQDISRRLSLAVLAGEEMLNHYKIERKRVYAAGWSGGARVASMLAFFQGDLFHGTIQSCGSDFYLSVPHVHGDRRDGNGGFSYGVFEAAPEEVDLAKQVRFTLITGPGDFRHGDMLDIYSGGFEAYGFQAKLFDVEGMGHENSNAATLQAALDFIEAGSGRQN